MFDSSKKQFMLHRTASAAMLSVYLIVTSTIGLFHNESCILGAEHAGTTNVLSCNKPCQACMFSAGFNSTEANNGPALVGAEKPFICQPSQHLAIHVRHEWYYSILLRAPPSAITS